MRKFKVEFDKYATDGYLGNTSGTDSYAYLRASSERQVEEGSSFSRQMQNIHKAAQRNDLRIPFDLIFFDDGYTGFEFDHRPALLKLLFEVKKEPSAFHLVIEDIDRLSRNADWHQGFLLEEFSRRNIEIHFFREPGSSLERYIHGYVAQEEMRKARERMLLGNRQKAMSGKITAKRPRYGYVLTKDSQYEFHPEESKVMRWVYERLLYRGWTLNKIAKELNDRGIPTRFKLGVWAAGTLYQMVKSPIYKGEFYANRHKGVKTGEYRDDGRPKIVMRERPRDEWILVKVPAIVTPEEWDLAREVLANNNKKGIRNNKRNWLLSGLIKCGICREYSYVAQLGNTKRNPRRYYCCNSRNSEKARLLKTACYSPYMYADELEQRVWAEIEQLIYDPSVIIRHLEEKQHQEFMMGYKEQRTFIENQINSLIKQQEKFESAFQRDIYTLDEFEEKMKDTKVKMKTLRRERNKLEAKISETDSLEDKKKFVLAALGKFRLMTEQAKEAGDESQGIPFDLKRKLLTLLVDVIWVNSIEKTFTIEGEIKGNFALYDVDDEPHDQEKGLDNFGFESDLKSR